MPATASQLTPAELAAREWPPLRARLIDVAAALDRLDAAGEACETTAVREQANSLLHTLLEPSRSNRAERLLTQLSREYDPGWHERFAAGQTTADPQSREAP